ncbi:MAG: thermonuclease family protein [Thaumarchaeota archaeon]|nr:thermonuclease family protein [Nitrososphaerota archaeon]
MSVAAKRVAVILAFSVAAASMILWFSSGGSQSPTVCNGSARCFEGEITDVYDGDTVYVAGSAIRLALTSAPELDEPHGLEAKEFAKKVCPIGSLATVDEDDGQTQGSFGRIVAVVYCSGVNLNEMILKANLASIDTRFCDVSEFANETWAQSYGC